MQAFVVSVGIATIFVLPVFGSDPECACSCATVASTTLKKDSYDSGTGEWQCSVVAASGEHCTCDVNGTMLCEVKPMTHFVMVDPSMTEGACVEVTEGVRVTPVDCPIEDKAFKIQMPGVSSVCVKPIIIESDLDTAYNLTSGTLKGEPFAQGLRDYWAALRFVYSTATDSVSVCGIYGEAKIGPRSYRLLRGDATRYNATAGAEISGSHPMSFVLLDAEAGDSQGVTPTGITAQNLWYVWQTDGWCANASWDGSYKIEFMNMRNMVGVLVNSRESDMEQATPVIAEEYTLSFHSGTAAMYDAYGASLDEYPQTATVDVTTQCGCP